MLEKNTWGWYQDYQIESLKLTVDVQKSRDFVEGRDEDPGTCIWSKTV